MADCLKLLHFHQGSQITNIRQIKAALNEAARVYTELVAAARGWNTSMSAAGWGWITTARKRISNRA